MVPITLTFDFPSQERADAAVNKLSELYGYPLQVAGLVDGIGEDGEPAQVPGSVANPESRLAYCKRKLGEELRERLLPHFVQDAQVGLAEVIRAQLKQTVVS